MVTKLLAVKAKEATVLAVLTAAIVKLELDAAVAVAEVLAANTKETVVFAAAIVELELEAAVVKLLGASRVHHEAVSFHEGENPLLIPRIKYTSAECE